MESHGFSPSHNFEESGPMTFSELHDSVPNSSSRKRKKEFKRQKAHHNKDTTENFTATDQQEITTHSTIEEPILNRLRSRLDPTYNVASAPAHAGAVMLDSDSLPESSTPAVDKPVKRTKKKRRDKPRDVDTDGQPSRVDVTASEAANSTTQVPVQDVGS